MRMNLYIDVCMDLCVDLWIDVYRHRHWHSRRELIKVGIIVITKVGYDKVIALVGITVVFTLLLH